MTIRLGIVGGYLGSGKSTFINQLLAGVLPGRTAVVVNDFGQVNIDAALVTSATQDTIELSNGCICCQISDDAARTMTALARRTDLDHVVCEVSGVGDPGQLARWQRFPGFEPGPVLVCADATSLPRLLLDEYVGDTVEHQVTAADVVVVTKTDLAPPPDVAETAATCRRLCPDALVLLQDATDPAATALEAFGAGRSPTAGSPGEGADVTSSGHARTHRTRTVELPHAVDVQALAVALEGQSERLVRAKGLLLDHDGQWHQLQLAAGRVDCGPWSPTHRSSDPALVLIAAGPDAEENLAAAAEELSHAAM